MSEQEIYRCHGCHTQKKISLAFCESCHRDSRAVMNKILSVFPEQQIREQAKAYYRQATFAKGQQYKEWQPTFEKNTEDFVESLRELWEQK